MRGTNLLCVSYIKMNKKTGDSHMRDISQLHPVLQEKLKQVRETCRERGFPIGIGECLRTVEEQNELYAQGRTNRGRL